MTGTEKLREQLEAMRTSLRAFDHPAVEEIAGLRLMHGTLRERESHIAQSIVKNETCSIELVLKGGGAAGPAGAVPALAGVLLAVSAGLAAAGAERAEALQAAAPPDLVAALTPHVSQLSVEDGDVTVLLTRPPGELAAQPIDPNTGAPLFEHAAVEFLEALRAASAPGGETVSEAVLPALCQLADVVAGGGMLLDISVEPFALDEAEMSVNQAGAQRLALRCASD